jgi:predicted O-methyltransferase YrrM
MLDIDVLIMIHHFAKRCEGDILEIGSFVGGSTIAAGLGVRDSGQKKKIISIEPGGRLKHHHLARRDIFRDLKKNLVHANLLDSVTLINGYSYELATIEAVRQATTSGGIGLFIFDADDKVRRDLDCYSDRLGNRSWIVIDDYFSESNKSGPTRAQVDGLVAAGKLVTLGFYGWGTWVGRWLA